MKTNAQPLLPRYDRRRSRGALMLLFLSLVLALLLGAQPRVQAQEGSEATSEASPNRATMVYLPSIQSPRQQTPFGAEVVFTNVNSSPLKERLDELGVTWIRMPHRILWSRLQPTENAPIDWGQLAVFEQELRALRTAGITPIVMVTDSPRWATTSPTSCGAIRSDKFGAFASFMRQLVNRYSQPDFNVHYWEIGNEPDVDPRLLPADEVYGCWGNIDDPYYGGGHYGNMLKAVAPVVRSADRYAKLVIGGLLLANPNTTTPGHGRPELFLEGILRAGAADSFDIVAFHSHFTYLSANLDYSGDYNGPWRSLGGAAKGKPAFLRSIMQRYGVSKPLFLNESTLTCPPDRAPCVEPSTEYLTQQASHIPRVISRSLNAGVSAFSWYTLDGPGWLNSSLLDASQNPRPGFQAYRTLVNNVGAVSSPPQLVPYASGLEAYRYNNAGKHVDVIWSITGSPLLIAIPQNKFIAAYSQSGTQLTGSTVGGNVQFAVGFESIYVHRLP